MATTHATPLIDSCLALIAQQANRAYTQLPQQHRRWADIGDLVQEGLLVAVRSERAYSPSHGAKYSTFLHRNLVNHYISRWYTPLRFKKRASAIVELDAPVSPDSDKTFEIPCAPFNPYQESNDAVQSLFRLCSRLSGSAAVFLVGGLLCHKWHSGGPRPANEASHLDEIKTVAKHENICMQDLESVVSDEQTRKKALLSLANIGSLGMGNEMAARLLECVRCTARLPLAAIQTGRYVVDSMTCRSCYQEMQNEPTERSCFGKLYDSGATECRIHCGDRVACSQFSEVGMSDEKTNAENVLDGVDLGDQPTEKKEKKVKKTAEKPAAKPTVKAKAKEEKAPAKKAAASGDKSEKKPEDAPPAEIGPRWPFKNGSMMLYCFKKCYKGISAKALKEAVEKNGSNFEFMKKLMSREHMQKNPSHSWKFSEDGGQLRIFDVKYIGEKPAKPAKAKSATK